MNNTLNKLQENLEKLAFSVKEGFDSMHEYLSDEFTGVKKDIQDLKQGQENILQRLDQHAYKIDVDHLKKRMDKVEKKIGIR